MALCLSLSHRTYADCVQSLLSLRDVSRSNEQMTFLVEFRVDLMHKLGKGDITTEELTSLFQKACELEIDFIITCRELEKVAKVHDAEDAFGKERLDMLKLGIDNQAAFVDLEIEAPTKYSEELVGYLKEKQSLCEVIMSYHNYEATPSVPELRQIVDHCFEAGATVAKIATTVTSMEDNASLLSMYAYFNEKWKQKQDQQTGKEKKVIILGMGELGKITRIAAIRLGSLLTFVAEGDSSPASPKASTKEGSQNQTGIISKATAPGQLTLQNMLTIVHNYL